VSSKEPRPEIIARQTQPIDRGDLIEPSRLDEVREELLEDVRREARAAGWEGDFSISLIVGDADMSQNMCVLRAEAVRR